MVVFLGRFLNFTISSFTYNFKLTPLLISNCGIYNSNSNGIGIHYHGIHVSSGRYLRMRGYRFRNRKAPPNSHVMLDKFMKYIRFDSTLIVRAPFGLDVRGSFFGNSALVSDDKTNRNQRMSKSKHFLRRNPANLVDNSNYNKVNEGKINSKEELHTDKTRKEAFDLVSKSENLSKLNRAERSILNNLTRDLGGNSHETPLRSNKISSLLVYIYGLPHHRVDSYSLVNGGVHNSHIYLTDAPSFEEAKMMFVHQQINNQCDPAAVISLFQPLSGEIAGDELNSDLKIYCPTHVLEANALSLKATMLVPIFMSKIYLETEREGCIELDGELISDLVSVGLCSQEGYIQVRDVITQEIRLSTRNGDIFCEGHLGGRIAAELGGDGNFRANVIDGPSLSVCTELGDIHVSDKCNSLVSQFFTSNGQVSVKGLNNQSYIHVKDQGSISVHVLQGYLTAIVKFGSILARIDNILEDTTLQVEQGDIIVDILLKYSFSIFASATRLNVATDIQNSGEFFVSKEGKETFRLNRDVQVSSSLSSNEELHQKRTPVLTVIVQNGAIEFRLLKTESDKAVARGYDSAT